VQRIEKRKGGECGGNNHRDDRCLSVRLWGDGWKLKRQWHELEDKAMVWGISEKMQEGYQKANSELELSQLLFISI